jgi:hypothetical protein
LPLDRSPTGDEVHNERDYRKKQKQMDEKTGGMKHQETAKPHHNKNYRNYQKHIGPAFCFRDIYSCANLLVTERGRRDNALLGD